MLSLITNDKRILLNTKKGHENEISQTHAASYKTCELQQRVVKFVYFNWSC